MVGFIGANTAIRLLEMCDSRIVGIDNLSDSCDVRLKEYRLRQVKEKAEQYKRKYAFIFIKGDLADREFVLQIFAPSNIKCGIKGDVEEIFQ